MRTRFAAAAAALVMASGLAIGQVRINEALINPPGTDNGLEFIELFSDTPNYSLNGLTLVLFEGDIGAANAGDVDNIIPLNGYSTGSNGLMLLRDALTIAFTPAPEAATNVYAQDFAPDLENGASTLLLVSGWTGTLTSDIDTNNDGTIDATFWTSVLGGFGWRTDGTNRGFQYASQLGLFDGTDTRPVSDNFTPDAYAFTSAGQFAFDTLGGAVSGGVAGEITPDYAGGEDGGIFAGYVVTPGRANIPAPAAFAVLGLAGVAAGRRRR